MKRQSFCVCCGWRQHTLLCAADNEGWMRIPGILYGLYLIFLRGGGLNQQRLSSGQSPSWQPILQSDPPLRLILLSALFLYVFFVIFNHCACLFLYHLCQINNNPSQAVAVDVSLFSKVCIKPWKRGVASILGFFCDNRIGSFYYSIFSVTTCGFCWLMYVFRNLCSRFRRNKIKLSFQFKSESRS